MPKVKIRAAKVIRASVHHDDGILVVPSRLSRDEIRSEMKRIMQNERQHQHAN